MLQIAQIFSDNVVVDSLFTFYSAADSSITLADDLFLLK
jgi:hypothetical protein